MPPEPKRPIEELLEASARRRREEFGGDPVMPNPMRVRLHDEIARRAEGDEPEMRARWLGIVWPRLALGAACAALVLGASFIWWRVQEAPGDGARVAMEQPAVAKDMDRTETAAAEAATGVPQLPMESDKKVSENAPPAAASAGMADNGRSASDETKSLALAQAPEKSSSAPEVFAQPAARPAIVSGGSVGQKRETDKLNFKQQFSSSAVSQAFRRDAKVRPATKILDSFQVEQDGAQIRVVDDDGSTYTGQIERLAQGDARNFYKEKKDDAAQARGRAARNAVSNKETNNEFYFRAAGYNDRLKKSLVFEGNYIVTAPLEEARARAALSKDGAQGAARIVGTAKVPGEPPVQVDAVTVTPK